MKVCTKCNLELPITSFTKDKSKDDGLATRCRSCVRERYLHNKQNPVQPPSRKVCTRCSLELPAEDFNVNPNNRTTGLSSWCRQCWLKYDKECRRDEAQQRRFREIQRRSRLKTRYGISDEKYHSILLDQSGGCAVCGTPDPGGRGEHFHIDHDHACCPGSGPTCGRCVRGLLCASCNNGLGMFRDDSEILRRAADYIDRRRPRHLVGGGGRHE